MENLSLIGASHNIWCMKLNSFVNTNSEMPPVSSPRDCTLGKWLYSGNLSYYNSKFSEIKVLEELHQNFHTLGSQIISLKLSGQVNEARQKLFLLQDYSDKIVDLLTKLQNQIN